MTFRDLITDLISKYGQGTLAEKVGTDDSTLSRFRSGQGALPMPVIENLIKEAGAILAQGEDIERLHDALAVMSDLWRKERYNRGSMIKK
jgi:hypothetical protein